MVRLRSLAFGIGLGALIAGLNLNSIAAQAATATLRGAELAPGYGRMLFQFDNAPKVTARVANGVLIIGFDEPVTVPVDRLLREMPTYLSVVRLDPDGRGMRLALSKPHRVNVIEAGEKVFIDIIPENWKGLLPGLPQEVIEELAKRVKTAELQARIVQKRKESEDPKNLNVRSAVLPTLHRLIFETPQTTPVEFKVIDDRLDVLMDLPLKLDPARVRPLLPAGGRITDVESDAGMLRFSIVPPDGWQVRAFREEEGLVIDLARPVAKSSPEAAVTTPDSAAAAKTATAPASPAAVGPVASVPAPNAPAANTPAVPATAPASPAAVAAADPAPGVAGANGPGRVEAAPSPQAATISATTANETTRVDFGFPRATAAAAYERGGVVTVVFDTIDSLDVAALTAATKAVASEAGIERQGKASVVRLTLLQPQIVRFAPDANTWSLTLGEGGVAAAQALAPRRGADERGQTVVSVPMPDTSSVHWIDTDGRGEPVAVVTAFGQAKALIKPQRFVDFILPQTAHGLAVIALADDLIVRASVGDVQIGKNSGLSLSPVAATQAGPATEQKQALLVDKAVWKEQRSGSTREKGRELMRRVLDATRSQKAATKLAYASFLIANDMASEAMGPINTLQAEDPAMRTDQRANLLKGIAQVMLHRHAEAEASLTTGSLKDDSEAGLWRALADARQQNMPKAFAGFRRASDIIDGYPEHLQATFRREVARAAIEMRDFAVAEQEWQALTDLPREVVRRDELALIRAMIDEATGRPDSALAGYKALFASDHRPTSAEAQLRGISLAQREKDKSISEEEALARLETVSATWRGGQSEIETLGAMGRIYADKMRWRDAFLIAKLANQVFPEHAITRRMHDETAAQFEELFTTGRSDTLPRVDALALFYDFKEFLPVGRRGDEIIRKLADRLVELDLLDQGADLLRHQMENRLNGAARSTVAARLAMVRLMAGKPAEALAAIQTTRLPELPADVRRARLLLEAKALSDLSRTDLALEILTAERGPEIDRLRADILWGGRRWREAGEAHERILGQKWQQAAPLSERERADVMRAGVAYVMADEALSLDRLRTKFAARMADSDDARAFAFVTGADKMKSADIRELARSVASADTTTEFLGEYRKRYPNFASSLKKIDDEAQAKAPGTPDAKADAPAKPSPQAKNEAKPADNPKS